jgi:hypothetical protein
MSMSVADSTVHRCKSLDQKVELLIERMSECVRFVREYMQLRTDSKFSSTANCFCLCRHWAAPFDILYSDYTGRGEELGSTYRVSFRMIVCMCTRLGGVIGSMLYVTNTSTVY